jgi:hypothetical protein
MMHRHARAQHNGRKAGRAVWFTRLRVMRGNFDHARAMVGAALLPAFRRVLEGLATWR